MVKEIGSEFHSTDMEKGTGLKLYEGGSFVFSGRTAIETVLNSIPNVRNVLLPSYCCDSMIVPFRNAKIEINFYNVNFQNKLKIDISESADIFLWCNYFGYDVNIPDFSEYGKVVIEDITHSLFSNRFCHSWSDFLVASLRKWEPIICGGYCAGVNYLLKTEDMEKPPEEFIDQKRVAMDLKAEYLVTCDKEKKATFLRCFGESNLWLSEHYSGLDIDGYSKEYLEHVDVEKQKVIRRRNAHVLYSGLKGKYCFLFPEEDMDCPLVVPIVISKGRDKIRQKLIDNEIYCPIHWPHPNAECESNLYDMELSLICDQRYTEHDMERIVSVLCD